MPSFCSIKETKILKQAPKELLTNRCLPIWPTTDESNYLIKLNSLPLSMLLPLGCLLSYLGVGMTFFICRLELLSRDGFVVSSLTMVISFSQHWFWTFCQTIDLHFLLKYEIDINNSNSYALLICSPHHMVTRIPETKYCFFDQSKVSALK